MSVDHESLKRVLMGIKGAARGFRKEKLQGRLTPDDVANPLDANPDDPVAPVGLEGSPQEESMESPMEAKSEGDDMDAAAKLEAIRKLIGSV